MGDKSIQKTYIFKALPKKVLFYKNNIAFSKSRIQASK